MSEINYNNFAQRTNFLASSPAFKNIPFFLKSVMIPNLSLSHPEVGGRDSYRMKLAADTVSFGPLSFEIIIDEDLKIYEEVFDIVTKQVSTSTGTFGVTDFDFVVSMNDNKGHEVLKFYFEGCRVSTLGDLVLDTADEGTEYFLSVDVDFNRFYIERPRQQIDITGNADMLNPPTPTYEINIEVLPNNVEELNRLFLNEGSPAVIENGLTFDNINKPKTYLTLLDNSLLDDSFLLELPLKLLSYTEGYFRIVLDNNLSTINIDVTDKITVDSTLLRGTTEINGDSEFIRIRHSIVTRSSGTNVSRIKISTNLGDFEHIYDFILDDFVLQLEGNLDKSIVLEKLLISS